MPTRRQLAFTLSSASTFLACLGSVNGLGSENNKPGLTSASITVAGSKFAPTSPTTISNKGNSLEEDYTIAKLDLAKAVFGPSPKDLSQHDSKPATPEQQEAYIRENKEQLLILGMLGIQSINNANPNSFDIRNYDGKIAMKLSRAVSLPYIPDIFSKMDPETKELMTDIYSSKEFIELQSQTIKLLKDQKGTEGVLKYVNGVNGSEFKELKFKSIELIKEQKGTEGVLEYVNALAELLQSAKVTSDIEAIKERIIKNSAPPPKQVSPNELRNSSASQLSERKYDPLIFKRDERRL